MSTYALEVRDISLRYPKKPEWALSNVSLAVKKGEILCVLGPSGSGKSTLLKVIAGIEKPASGTILIEGVPQERTPTEERDLGYVFQTTDALLPHLSVYKNVDFPLQLKRHSHLKQNRIYLVNEMLALVHLTHKRDQYPTLISGGERQRVAIARSLVYKPKLLLLDEPLSSLDNTLKRDLVDLILELRNKLRTTMVYVTHDDREALELADSIVILNDGRLLQQGSKHEIVNAPISHKVAAIVGGWNIFDGTYKCAQDGKASFNSQFTLNIHPIALASNGNSIKIGIRSSRISVTSTPQETNSDVHTTLTGQVIRSVHDQTGWVLVINSNNIIFRANVPVEFSQTNKQPVYMLIHRDDVVVWAHGR